MKESPQIASFNGLNNVTDPYRLGLSWLTSAENVDVTRTGGLRSRDGYAQALAASVSAAYAGEKTYIVDGGALKQVMPDLSTVAVRAGLSASPVYWAEINGQVFYSGENKGIIGKEWMELAWEIPAAPKLSFGSGRLPAGTYQATCTRLLADGRETGSGDVAEIAVPDGSAILIEAGEGLLTYVARAETFQLCQTASWNGEEPGVELATQFLRPIPENARQIAFWQGRLFAAEYFAGDDISLVWISEPLGFHLFRDFFAVPGEVRLLAPASQGLIVGTDTNIHIYDGNLAALADYGAVKGDYADDNNRVLFWTEKGLCAGLPFENLTEQQLRVAPGFEASVAVIEKYGDKKAVVSLALP
jgi:hypothetical protein